MLVVGDSITFGVDDRFPDDGYGYAPILERLLAGEGGSVRMAGFGLAGSRELHPTRWVESRLREVSQFEEVAALAAGADAVLLLGPHVNDVSNGVEPDETEANLRDVIDGLADLDVDRIFLSTEPSTLDALTVQEILAEQRRRMNAIIRERADVEAGPDLFAHFAEGRRRTWWLAECPQHLHPNGFGMMEIAALLYASLYEHGVVAGPVNERPDPPAISSCTAAATSVTCALTPPSDPDGRPGGPLAQLAWAVPTWGECGCHAHVDLDGDGDVGEHRVAPDDGRFTLRGLDPATPYDLCAVTYDGAQASFFASGLAITRWRVDRDPAPTQR